MQPRPLTHDECRRTLRRLELDAYASLVSVLRAQGGLGAERRRVLDAVRAALHIGPDRHSAEARRASNDELLAAIAEQVSGPNTGLGWIKEGRRKIPILPRGIPQTVYTAIADRAAAKAVEENDSIARRKLLERQAASRSSPQTPADASEDDNLSIEGSTVDDKCNFKAKKNEHPPVVMCDQTLKMLSDEGPPRKRSRSDATAAPHRMTHQKHHNLSQIYNSYSKHAGKMSNQYSRNSYNQSGKTGIKSNHANLSKSAISKHRSIQKHGSGAKHCGQVAIPHHQVRSGIKSPTDPHIVGSQAMCVQNQTDVDGVKSQTPSYRASYAQPSARSVDDPSAEAKWADVGSAASGDSLAAQRFNPNPTPQRTNSEESADSPNVKIQPASAKPCHIIIKNKNENSIDPGKKIQITNKQVISKQDLAGIKVLQNRPLVVSTSNSNSQKLLNSSGKLITTKIVQHIPAKSQPHLTNIISQAHPTNPQTIDKVLIVPKSPTVQSNVLQRSASGAPLKNIYLSTNSPVANPNRDGDSTATPKFNDGDASKNVIINSDVKLTTKTFLFNAKSGQKMVVLPAKPRPKTMPGQSVPLLQVKGVQKQTVKLVPVSGQSINSQTKSGNVTVLSKTVNPGTPTKIISKEILNPVKTNLPSGDVAKVLTQVQITPKGLQHVKAPAGKGNLIVVQKSNAIGKTPITIKSDYKPVTANKVVIDSHQTEILFPDGSVSAESHEESVSDKGGDVFFMDLNNDGVQTNKSISYGESDETLNDSKMDSSIGEDAPMFDSRAASDEGNTDSVGSSSEILMDSTMKSEDSYGDSQSLLGIDKPDDKASVNQTTNLSSFTDWEAELANAADKQNDAIKMGNLNLELEMSSDSDVGNFAQIQKPDKESEDVSQDEQEDTNEMFVQHSSISFASRTLLSQLQDDGSSSNDSPFVLTKNLDPGRLELLESSQTSSSAME